MSICIYVCVYLYIGIYIHTSIYIHTHVYMRTGINAYICIYMYTYVYDVRACRPGAVFPKASLTSGERVHIAWVAVQELNFLGNPRFPLKGSFKGDVDIDIESYHIMDVSYHDAETM